MNQQFVLATASFCGPCKMLKDRIETAGLSNKVEFKNMEDNMDFFRSHNIKSVPQLLIMNGGVVEVVKNVEDIFTAITNA